MALNPQEKSGSSIGLPDSGTVPARLSRIIELGRHDTKFGVKDQVQMWYSLPTRIITDDEAGNYKGKQHQQRTRRLTKSSNEKAALMDHVRVLDPHCTGLEQLLNKACYLTLEQNDWEGTTYSNITNIMNVPEGMEVGEADTEPFYFDFDNPDAEIWDKHLWDNIKEQIMEAENYPGSAVEKMVLHAEAMSQE